MRIENLAYIAARESEQTELNGREREAYMFTKLLELEVNGQECNESVTKKNIWPGAMRGYGPITKLYDWETPNG
jgi:hypothetical protein